MVVVPLLAALILVQTLDGGERIVLDARLPPSGSRRCSSGAGPRSWSSCSARQRPALLRALA